MDFESFYKGKDGENKIDIRDCCYKGPVLSSKGGHLRYSHKTRKKQGGTKCIFYAR